MSQQDLWQPVVDAAKAGDVEATLDAIAGYLTHAAEQEPDPLVSQLLTSSAEACQAASMDYYVSTK